MEENLKRHITDLAARYETKAFLAADPSSFMHRVAGEANQEAMAFMASCLSYGSRKQFFPKIEYMLNASEGHADHWVRHHTFRQHIDDSDKCYYRLNTCHDIRQLLEAYSTMLNTHGSMKSFVSNTCGHRPVTGLDAVAAITSYFAAHGIRSVIPQDTKSACKRVCMFLRWMVRDNSPVDLGLWADIIDKKTLVMPLDTHVVQEARNMGLISSRTTSMTTALRLTEKMKEVFPDDPLKADFALFGLGVDDNREALRATP